MPVESNYDYFKRYGIDTGYIPTTVNNYPDKYAYRWEFDRLKDRVEELERILSFNREIKGGVVVDELGNEVEV